MLDLLRSAHGCHKFFLTPEFKRDLRWFAKFLPTYNGVSLSAASGVSSQDIQSIYDAMFRTFVAFCIVTKCALVNVNVKVVLSFLECLAGNSCSACMIANHVSAI